MCRVVSCPACGSVDSRAPSSFPCVLRLALLRFFSFFATTTITIVTSINHRLRLLLHALFFFFFISSPPSTSLQLKKSQFQRKEILFFCQATPNLRISKFTKHSFFIFFCTGSTSSLSTQLLSLPSFIQFFGGFDYSTIASFFETGQTGRRRHQNSRNCINTTRMPPFSPPTFHSTGSSISRTK
ncbi:hypothetical protein V8E52_006022 [Russula decolorans]